VIFFVLVLLARQGERLGLIGGLERGSGRRGPSRWLSGSAPSVEGGRTEF